MNAFLIALTISSLFIYNVIQTVFLLLIPRRFKKKKDITGQNVLITGAGSGLGRQLAIELSSHTTCLLLLDIDIKALQQTKTLLEPCSSVFIYECDITDRKMVYKVADDIKRDVGDVVILINNAGVVCGMNLLDLPDEQIIRTIEVNALAHFWICKSFLPGMMSGNRGHVVFVNSLAGYLGSPKLTDYCASKFATVGFAESLELELKVKRLDGVKVTIVCPSQINTGLFDGLNITVTPTLTPEYVAKEIVWGIQEDAETIILPYYMNFVLMLKMIVPRWLTHRVYELTGNMAAMDNFRGRPNTNNAPTKIQ